MPANDKVGSWLGDAKGAADGDESDGSDSAPVQRSNGQTRRGEDAEDEEDDDEDEEVNGAADGIKREENVDWETVLPKVRPALEDPSDKRRRTFIGRYLYVSESSPPPSSIGPLLQAILGALPLLLHSKQVDDAISLLQALVERDEKLEEGAASKAKLAEKLGKWTGMEVGKAVDASRSKELTISTTLSTFNPHLLLILGLITSLNSTRGTEALVASPIFADLLLNLAYVADAIEGTQNNGKENSKVERARRKAHTRIWRGLRLLRSQLGQILHTLATRAVPQPAKLAVLIGHVVGVISRLKPRGPRKPSEKLNPDLSPIMAEKDALLSFYSSNIIGSKTALPVHVPRAFGPTLALIVDESALKDKLLPTAERMLLRSPEVALELTAELINGASIDLSSLLPGKLVPSTLSSSKSSNADTRSKSQTLMRALCAHCADAAVREKIVVEILSLPKSGKTASAEHRATLFAMLKDVQPTEGISTVILDTLVPLISKEANEAASVQLGAALSVHMGYVIREGVKVSEPTVALLAKELSSTKIGTRRLLSNAIGSSLWALSSSSPLSPETEKLIVALLPSFETNLATASANAPANPAGFLEGYVAAALAFGPLAQREIEQAKRLQEAAKALQVVSPKPSFLLNDKAYGKLSEEGDELWALRALEGAVKGWGNKLPNEQIRSATGAALLHFTLSAKSPSARAAAIRTLPSLAATHPRAAHALLRESITAYLQAQEEAHKVPRIITPEEAAATESHAQKLGSMLEGVFAAGISVSSGNAVAALEGAANGSQDALQAGAEADVSPVAPSASAEKELLADLAIDLLVPSHHPFLMEGAQTSWINLVITAGLDASALVVERRERVLMRLWESASAPPKYPKMAQAAYRAVTTLAFVCPALYVPTFMDQIKVDLEPKQLDFVGLEERGIWITPADQTYVDVLAPKKDNVEDKNRRDYATEKWEAEVRASQAAKRAASGAKLSKADQAAVSAQLVKEAEVRARIATVQAKLQRGMAVVRALVSSNASQVEREVGTLAKALLAVVFAEGAFLLDESAFEVFLSLTTLASDRLGEYRRLVVSAILRSRKAPLVPEDYLEEPVKDLVTRLMHQLQFLSSQTAFDAPTYSLVSLLLSEVVAKGGIETEGAQSEEAQEQLTLAVNIMSENVSEFTDDAYPRHATIKDLVHLIRTYPRLAKDASSALVDLGAALQDVAKPDEITEMIQGTLSKDSNVRNAVLQALQPVDLTELDYSVELWIALHDADEQNANLATHLWEDNGLDIPETYLAGLVPFLAHDSAAVRTSTASALAAAAEIYPAQIQPTLIACQELYKEKSKLLMPEYDRFGMVILETLDRPDPWEARVAIALGMQKLAPSLSTAQVEPIFAFLINEQALGDRHGQVRRAMLDAGIAIIDLHGGECIASLMKTFEDYLATAKSTSEAEDYIKEAVVILFGRLAGHLDASDPRIPKVVDRLVEALNTPSELVQSAVADCLPPLVGGMGDEVEYLVDKLFSTLTTGAKYASRRGAAYGLAGVVKGRGLGLLKEYEVMDKLIEAAEDKDKGAFQGRQGAVFAFETLSATLGKVFEPYIISIIPQLLTLFGDANTDVREAVQDSAQVIMSKISGHCVKRILPDLLDALEEKQWRTKKGAIELLGAMAFCAPRQLSLSLPTIIPHLTGVINDSHAQVKSAANTSLKRFGEVLNNPEVKAMQSTLMKALADPTAKTENALKALLKTSFEHYLDAPSLALVMPIIDRGLRQRSSETKRKSVQIVGNMASLTESRDLVPYLNELMPLVHEVLVDPVPEARATAAKSLGTLVERLGENNFPELVQQLLTTLRSETSGVDRQGAAQGLSEVLSGLGMERLESMLPDIITSTSSPRPYIREGFISLLVYLPATFGHRFAPHLGRVIPPILNGLADDSEYVREASMRAGKMIIANYSSKAIDLLLPELEKGMLDPSWRIRQSSISLTGELLYRVTGISGKVELEEDEVPAQGADHARKVLLEALGAERRDRVLATLYIVRQDSVAIVRQASIHIWKALVQNTPRTTREILSVLMGIIMSLLGSDESVQQETASRTLGELCRKNGERIFGEIIPILQKAISSPDTRSREGACLAFADVMSASNREVLEDHEDAIISAIRKALVDDSASVRAAAAQTFDTAQHYMGAKAVDQTIPTLLEAMREPGEASETALQALQEVMSVRANSVFPVLIPTLIVQPITAFNARALGALVKVAGSALNKRLDTILNALVKSLEKEQDEDIKADIQSAIESLLESVVDADGVHQLEMLLIGWAKDNNGVRRATGCRTFATLCQVSQADTSDYRVDWIRILVSALDDVVPEVVDAAWEALDHFVKTIDKDELEDLVVPLRRTISGMSAPGQYVRGFSRPKGVQSIVPILLAGVLSGTQEQRENAALGIGELVQRTSEAAIKPYIIQLTGPLIRVISGQGLAPQIKSAILQALTVMLEQVPLLVRPFHPQLTRTFVKSASDPAALSVRGRAAEGLGELMKHQPRVDPLITELVGNIRSAEKEIAPSVVCALAAVCASAGKNIGPAAKASIVDLVEEAFAEPRGENYSQWMGKVVAGLAQHDPEDIRGIVDSFLTTPLPPTQMSSLTIRGLMEQAPEALFGLDVVDEIIEKTRASISSDSSAISRPARDVRDLMKEKAPWRDDSRVQAAFK